MEYASTASATVQRCGVGGLYIVCQLPERKEAGTTKKGRASKRQLFDLQSLSPLFGLLVNPLLCRHQFLFVPGGGGLVCQGHLKASFGCRPALGVEVRHGGGVDLASLGGAADFLFVLLLDRLLCFGLGELAEPKLFRP